MRLFHCVGTLVMGTLLMGSTGCVGRVIGEGAEGALGPKGAYFEQKPAAPARSAKVLSDYGRFELGEVRNEVPRLVPGEFLREFPRKFGKELRESRLARAAGGKTLVFDVTIIHYEKADTEDNVFGPLEQVVARVRLLDKESGEVLAEGNAIGRTGKTVGLGAETKAEGLARALIKWVEDYWSDKR